MGMRTKTFDCVRMKHDAQKRIQEDWARRKGDFRSYGEFLQATLAESEWGRRMWQKVCSSGASRE